MENKLTVTHIEEVINLALKKLMDNATALDYAKQVEALFWIRGELIKLIPKSVPEMAVEQE